MVARILVFGLVFFLTIAVVVYVSHRIAMQRMAYEHEAEQAKADRDYDQFIAAVEDDARSSRFDDDNDDTDDRRE